MAKFNPEHKAVLDKLLLSHPLVQPGKMFGYPPYYVGGKLCICLYEQGIGIKLPADIASGPLESDSTVVPFMPLGRPKMREWVQINLERSKDYARYLPILEESIRYVYSQQDKEAARQKSVAADEEL